MAYELNSAGTQSAFAGNSNFDVDEVNALMAQLTNSGVFEAGGLARFAATSSGTADEGSEVIDVVDPTGPITTNLAARIIIADDETEDLDITLKGSNNKSVVMGHGDDVVRDQGGAADALFGNEGNDTIYAGAGSDHVAGGDDNDELHGDVGDDTVGGGNGVDLIFGDAGDDLLGGGDGSDTVSGGVGEDRIYGDGGDDILRGDSGNDTLNGGDGNDLLEGGVGDDVLDGSNDNDTVMGGSGSDTIIGGSGADMLVGDGGDDLFVVGAVGAGNDTIVGGAGDDSVAFNEVSKEDVDITESGGVFTVVTDDGTYTISSVETLLFTDGSIDLTDENS